MDPAISERTQVRRHPERACYQRSVINSILDEALVCHVGVVVDGEVRVIPTSYARVEDTLYVHGSTGSASLGALSEGGPACVTVTLLDGLVLARSSFHHSLNYRCVVVFATARLVSDEAEKRAALVALVEHIVPGRTAEVRPPSRKELAATTVLALSLREASAKVRSGPPIDDAQDLASLVWAGELPVQSGPGLPVADALTPAATAVPGYLAHYRRPAAGDGPTRRKAPPPRWR